MDFATNVDAVATMPHVDETMARDASVGTNHRYSRLPYVTADYGT